MTYRLASIGFSSHEQKIIQDQLAILRNTMDVLWVYAGDEAKSAHLTISRTIDPVVVQRTVGLLAVPRGGVYTALQFDWPLSVMAVKDLLNNAEGILASGNSAIAGEYREQMHRDHVGVVPRLLKPGKPMSVSVGETKALIYPALDNVTSTAVNTETLIGLLRQNTFRLTLNEVPPYPPSDWSLTASFKSILWSLALKEGPPDSRWSLNYEKPPFPPRSDSLCSGGNLAKPLAAKALDDRGCERRFRVGQWPFFGKWETRSEYMRLAALYTSKEATIAEGCRFASLETAKVEAFLYACGICDLQLSCEVRLLISEPPAPREKRSEGGWLSRLRAKLGLRTHWDNPDRPKQVTALF